MCNVDHIFYSTDTLLLIFVTLDPRIGANGKPKYAYQYTAGLSGSVYQGSNLASVQQDKKERGLFILFIIRFV